jgi:hypothetical protein
MLPPPAQSKISVRPNFNSTLPLQAAVASVLTGIRLHLVFTVWPESRHSGWSAVVAGLSGALA